MNSVILWTVLGVAGALVFVPVWYALTTVICYAIALPFALAWTLIERVRGAR